MRHHVFLMMARRIGTTAQRVLARFLLLVVATNAITFGQTGWFAYGAATGEELIINGSFENTAGTFVATPQGVMSLGGGNTSIPGWAVVTGETAWLHNTNTYGGTSPFGSYFVDLTGVSGPNSTLTQTIQTVAGRGYRVSLALGYSNLYPGRTAVLVCAGSTSAMFVMSPENTPGNQWQNFSFGFVAEAAATMISIAPVGSTGSYVGVDNVSVLADPSVTPPAENLVENGSFEVTCATAAAFVPDANGIVSLPIGSTGIPGWTTTNAELAWAINGNPFGPRTVDGSLFLDLTGYHDALPFGGVTQMLTTQPNEGYRLRFSLGSDEDRSPYRGPMSVAVTIGTETRNFTFTPAGTGNQWGEFIWDFTATTASTPLTFIGTSSAGGQYLGLDNVSVSSGGPELEIAIPDVNPENQVQLSFSSAAGKNYAIQTRDNLGSGTWTTLAGTERTGTGATIRLDLPFASNQHQRFYRLQVGP
jgi:hypothetical protein